MHLSSTNKLLGNYVITIVIAVTLFVSPWNSIDPTNLPKLSLLGVFAFVAAVLALSQKELFSLREAKLLLLNVVIFVFLLLLNLMVTPLDLAFQFYGTPGRSTGVFAYFSLTMILLASVAATSKELLKRFVFGLLGVGITLAFYGIAQWQELDFFDYVNAYGSNVTGTLGNPNFHSALMGIVASVALIQALFGRVKSRIKLFYLLLFSLAILNIRLSSEQGYISFLVGLISGLAVYLFTTKREKLGWVLFGLSSVGGIIFVLGLFNAGPFADIVYKSSLQARGFYWRAALTMLLENPAFGVGLDGYGDWYRRSRTEEIANFNPGLVTDTAHSIPLDIAAGGGFPLLIAYGIFIILAVISVVRIVRRSQEFDVMFASIVAAWTAYQAQSIISINQIGLGVWGWSLTGLLIGYEMNSRSQIVEKEIKSVRKRDQAKDKLPAATLLMVFVAGAIGLIVSLPPYLAANKFYRALQSSDGNVIQQSANLKPYDRIRFLYTIKILASNNLEANAITVLADATKIYPDNFELWQQWSQIPSAAPAQIAKAKAEMKRLDPYNPDLK
jgi:O-antigen ligase